MDYSQFLETKTLTVKDYGFDIEPQSIHPKLFDYQRDIVKWSLQKGRVALFEDVGLGKTIQFGEWLRQINRPSLIVSPLAVVMQTVDELKNLVDMDVRFIRSSDECDFDESLFHITNYEMIESFDPDLFDAVVLDESSILKNLMGKTRIKLVSMFAQTPFRMCATATPAPNNIAEIGNHAEFLGIMTEQQMKSVFFVHDSQLRNGAWRLKKHATTDFYKWLGSWSVALTKPSDLGYSDVGFEKPEVRHHIITVDTDYQQDGKFAGFEDLQISATDAKRIRRESINQRLVIAQDLINNSDEQFIVWCDLNNEAYALDGGIDDAVNVEGKMKFDAKIKSIQSFVDGETKVLVSKTKIAGMGVNLQNCKNMVWFGLGYSWEQFYQGIGRICRYGQASTHIDNYIIVSRQERGIVDSIFRKNEQANVMRDNLIENMSIHSEVRMTGSDSQFEYATDESSGDGWRMWLGDSAERMREIPDNSVHLSVYSPPFNDIFVYSNSERDLGNSANLDEFMQHYQYVIDENYRITMDGRMCAVHISELRTLKGVHGYRGLIDWSSMVIKAYTDAGWIYRSRITIDKDPQALAIRTKDNDLLFATARRDSASSAPMSTEYILLFKKQGDNPIPIKSVERGEVTQEDWIRWARAVWYDIKETDVLNTSVAKSNDDEKHMCPLALPIIERCVKMWSNPDEIVFSPFGGIGSEGYEALRLGRQYHGIELKPEYFEVATRNLQYAETLRGQMTLFDLMDVS